MATNDLNRTVEELVHNLRRKRELYKERLADLRLEQAVMIFSGLIALFGLGGGLVRTAVINLGTDTPLDTTTTWILVVAGVLITAVFGLITLFARFSLEDTRRYCQDSLEELREAEALCDQAGIKA